VRETTTTKITVTIYGTNNSEARSPDEMKWNPGSDDDYATILCVANIGVPNVKPRISLRCIRDRRAPLR
jgi:hypothetical protein